MKTIIYLIFSCILICSCKSKVEHIIITNEPEIEEFFIDDEKIGKPGNFKIKVIKQSENDFLFTDVLLYKKTDTGYFRIQKLTFPHSYKFDLDVKIEDYNNDGFNDLTYTSHASNRGGNIIRNLVIFDSNNNQLVPIKNSENYPNIEYNKELNCINTYIFTATLESLFLKLSGDSLIPFAGVGMGIDSLSSYLIDSIGNYKTLETVSKTMFSDYSKFKNYAPITEYQRDNVFEGFEYANFKLDYFHTEGYSTGNRYWYEIIVIDSLLTLYFDCPLNDDWNKIHYHKSIILGEDRLTEIKNAVKKSKVSQKKYGIPNWSDWSGSGYGENRLYIESDKLNIAGGMIYNCMGTFMTDFSIATTEDKQASTTIGGNYEYLFLELEKLFPNLPQLMEDKNQKFE